MSASAALWILAAVACNAAAQLVLKHTANLVQAAQASLTAAPSLWQASLAWLRPGLFIGALLYTLSFILTLRIYTQHPLGLISPLMAGAIFILVNLGAWTWFAEPLTASKWLGIALVIAGISVLARA